MKRRYRYIIPLMLLILMLAVWQLIRYFQPAVPIAPQRPMDTTVLLIPLDGRPPCRQFVIDAGRIAGTRVEAPPTELQDYYSQPGDTQGMRQWLSQEIGSSQSAILSIDQLLYGGLLAAREKEVSPAEIDSLLQYLRKLHAEHPDIPLYAFSILPRQTPQDTIDGYQERKDLLAYSRLKGRQAEGLPIDEQELMRLEKAIPAGSMSRYLAHFEENKQLNEALIRLVHEGVLAQLILGQDDGEPFSIPNIEKNELKDFIASQDLPTGKVILTHGADEIALSLLATIKNRQAGYCPRIFVQYNSPATPDRVMPYMAISTAETVREKIALLGGEESDTPDAADFTLFVSTCNSDEDDLASRMQTVGYLQIARKNDQPVALVDLSKHFTAQETVLPLLLDSDYPINNLIAYAGWNTTSNSIGTALAQASLYEASRQQAVSLDEMIGLTAANLTFLQNRLLEDYFYLKEDIDLVNLSLQKAGYHNTADLDLEHNHRWANRMLQGAMKEHLAAYKNTRAFRQPVTFASPSGGFTLLMQDMTADLSYPWPRTFEIWLETTPYFAMPTK
ncbi:Protein of unknown function [Selenomonas sp. GACV-9]|uniref:DUF4127 family protein n=1 Tax=Selenomonas sp. GACV-9 TaxID=3158782 RepID=UPI0008E61A87|nr:Protein of unknown function [Selenomonas ruminantium]